MEEIVEVAVNLDDVGVVDERLDLELTEELFDHIGFAYLSFGDDLYCVNCVGLALEDKDYSAECSLAEISNNQEVVDSEARFAGGLE